VGIGKQEPLLTKGIKIGSEGLRITPQRSLPVVEIIYRDKQNVGWGFRFDIASYNKKGCK
jgi:hypothetical protein